MNLKYMTVPLLGALMTWPATSQAAINVDRTRIIMTSEQKSVSVLLTNESRDTPYLAQAWVQDSAGNTINNLLALPPLQRIDPGKKAQVRIMQIHSANPNLPQDRESLFYFNVREIPPVPTDKNANILQLSAQSQLKLFLRPTALANSEGASPEQSLQALQNHDAMTLTLKNPTPYHITVIWLGLDRQQRLPGFDSPTMIPPFSEQTLSAQLPPNTSQFTLGNVDDYGGLRMNLYSCQHDICSFQKTLK